MWRYYVRKYKSVFLWTILGIGLVSLVIYGICSQSDNKEDVEANTFAGTAFGTAVKKTIYTQDQADAAKISEEINHCLLQLENTISVRESGSEVAKCNQNYVAGGVYELSDDVLDYLKKELEIADETDGAFSPCIRPLSALWGIEDGETDIPDDDMIKTTLKYIDPKDIELVEDGIIFKKDGMAIDFGAAGKGIACDKVMEQLKASDIEGAVISIGGSIAVYGDKEKEKEWHIGIRDPRGTEEDVMGVLDCQSGIVVSTSGDYEKYFEADGKRYHHILDPATGYPADNGLISVTVICEKGLLSDAMSTACFVMGLDKGMEYAKEKGVEAIFITEDKQVYITDGIRKSFHIKNTDYTLSSN